MLPEFEPPFTAPDALLPTLRQAGFAVLRPAWVANVAETTTTALFALARDWEDMPLDGYLRDGGHYRRRRHASFVVDGNAVQRTPHRAHFQSPTYNALHGGMERWFEPMHASLVELPLFGALLAGLGAVCSALRGPRRWHVEAHQFRIDTSDGIGRPTPEGAHRDGVDFVALLLVARAAIRGGETRVFDADRPTGVRFTLSEPWSLLLLDDHRVIHESTPIRPAGLPGELGYRDTLVLTFRQGGFQEPSTK